MRGPEILARSLSTARIKDRFGNVWQYHSQSDNHSKIACWVVLYDLLQHCPLLVHLIRSGKVGFGINHEMRDFRTGRKKYLDLVLCTPRGVDFDSESFAALTDRYSIALTEHEAAELEKLPPLNRVPVGSVHVALEAKACMTEHVKALPRLYDELNSSHLAIHGSADFAIAVGFAMVNSAKTFLSPGRNKQPIDGHPTVTLHRQPDVTVRTIEKLREIPRRTQLGAEGFDAFGIVVIDMKNDGSAVEVVTGPPAPSAGDVLGYDQMVHRIAALYATKFGNV